MYESECGNRSDFLGRLSTEMENLDSALVCLFRSSAEHISQ